MEKTLTIYTLKDDDGNIIEEKKVKFESRGSTPIRYKKQFGSDFFGDLVKLAPLVSQSANGDDLQETVDQMSMEQLQHLDMEVFYNIAWVLAKTADPDIPDPIEWLDGFEKFPIMHVITGLDDIIKTLVESGSETKKK